MAALPGRVGPILLYVYGLTRWGDEGGVGSLSLGGRVAYVLLGLFFCSLSLAWLTLMGLVRASDREEAQAARAREGEADADGEAAEEKNDDGESSGAASDAESGLLADVRAKKDEGRSSVGEEKRQEVKRQLPAMSIEEYERAAFRPGQDKKPSRLLIAIDSIVYCTARLTRDAPPACSLIH